MHATLLLVLRSQPALALCIVVSNSPTPVVKHERQEQNSAVCIYVRLHSYLVTTEAHLHVVTLTT